MCWRNAPFLLKLVLILTIASIPTLTLAQVAEAGLPVTRDTAASNQSVMRLAATLDIAATEIAPPKTGQVIKLIPSGRVISPQPAVPVEEVPDTPVLDTSAPTEIAPATPVVPVPPDLAPPDLAPPEKTAPEEPAAETKAPGLNSPELETKTIPTPEPVVPSLQQPSIPYTSPAQADQERSTDKNSLAIWLLLLPSVLLGLFWTVWRRQKAATLKSEARSKPTAQSEPTISVAPQSPAPTVAPPAERVEQPIESQIEVIETPEASEVQGELQEVQVEVEIEAQKEQAEVQTEPKIETQAEIQAETQVETQAELEESQITAIETSAEAIASPAIEVEELLTDDEENVPAAVAIEENKVPLANIFVDRTVSPIQQAFRSALLNFQGKTLETATLQECYAALVRLITHSILDAETSSLSTPENYLAQETRLVIEIATTYSPEFQLANTLMNLGFTQPIEQAMQGLGLDLRELYEQEQLPELGDHDLGRVMLSYLEALATADIPAIGYGIRYEQARFEQQIHHGWQIEVPNARSRSGNVWEKRRLNQTFEIKFGGQTQAYVDDRNHYRVRWVPQEVVTATAYDVPITGYKTNTVNILRLWQAETPEQRSPLMDGLQDQVVRLKRQFFLVSCVLQDLFRLHLTAGGQPETLHDRFAVQMNEPDTLLTIAELMRLLLDEYGIAWNQAWSTTQATLSYTHHAPRLETFIDSYSLGTFSYLLPRHLEIIYEINSRLLTQIRISYPGEIDRVRRMSLINERGDRFVRLIYLACLGSHAVNGNSELQTQTLQKSIFKDFNDLYPDKFISLPDGVSLRRLPLLNPQLTQLMTEEIGEKWLTDLAELDHLEEFVEDWQFCQEWQQVKQNAKQNLAHSIQQQYEIAVNPNSLFDVQIAPIQDHQRQLLSLLYIITLYHQIKANPALQQVDRTFIFAGKAAPNNVNAKLVIKLIHNVAQVINTDSATQNRLKIVFLQRNTLQLIQSIYAAADVAEFIAFPGTDARSTENLTFAMNGAIILGTPDRSNLELQKAVGTENIFLFGFTNPEVAEFSISQYTPINYYNANLKLQQAIDSIAAGAFSEGDTELFKPLIHDLQHQDPYRVLADYQAYVECQDRVRIAYQEQTQWLQKSILNTARIGRLSSDRAVREYSLQIWDVRPVTERLREFTKLPSG